MSSKKQQSASSSESTTSTSSNSSSSSSSSSGSDSSSSDSEGTSSSQNSNIKSGPENDKAAPKRVKPVPNSVKSKKQEEKKTPPPKKGAAIYSSESDESPIKPSPVKRRLSNTKPKVSATVNVVQKTSRSSVCSTRNSRSESSHKSAIEKNLKNSKARSIFSPDNSSESDVDKNCKSTAVSGSIKSLAKSSLNSNSKENDIKKTNKRSRSSGSASTSDSTDSSSETDSSDNSSVTNNKVKPKETSDKLDSEKTESENSRNQTKSKTSESSEVESNKRGIVTRKLTRSSSTRRSKHLIGKAATDTESETDSKISRSAKKTGPKGPIIRNKNSKGLPSRTATQHCDIVTERKCPVEGCNSLGHYGGNYEKHFTIEACPLYHNKTPEECQQMAVERKKKEEERKRAVMSMSRRSPKGHSHHFNNEQRSYQLMVKEIREKFQERGEINDVKVEEKERECRLEGIASEHDLKLFQEAQAVASEKIEDDLKTLPNISQTKYVEMGRFEMEVWYQSPYPEDYAKLPKLYLCEYCLRYMKTRTILKRHIVKCVWKHPPGEEVYSQPRKLERLALMSKTFRRLSQLLASSAEWSLRLSTDAKEKNSFLNYNVSCILTLPPYQRQGYGRLLIDFSYLLTREEGKIGSPEKPLSDLGLISYRSYWKDVLLEYLCNFGGKEISIKDISQEMAINSYDIVSTLQALGMMKYWKGKHIILKKQDEIEEYIDRVKRRDLAHKEIDKKCLKWAPFTPSQPQNSS